MTANRTPLTQGLPPVERLFAESLEALSEPGMVERLLAGLAAHLGSSKVMMKVVLPPALPDGSLAPSGHVWGLPDSFQADYDAHIYLHDEWSHALARQQAQALSRGGSLSQQLLPTHELRRTAFYSDYLRPLGIDAMVNGIVEASVDRGVQVLGFLNDIGRPEFTPEQFNWLQSVLPWVRSLMRARQRALQDRRRFDDLAAALNQLPLGLAHIGRNGQVRYLNDPARDWLGVTNDTRILLWHADGWQTRRPLALQQLYPALHTLTQKALAGGDPVSTRLHAHYRHPLVAVATPLQGDTGVQLVLVPEVPAYNAATVAVCAALYGMTKAEAALIPLLLQGMTPREMAEAQGVKLPTVRTQLASLFAKTGTRRQAELAQRVMRVTAMVTA